MNCAVARFTKTEEHSQEWLCHEQREAQARIAYATKGVGESGLVRYTGWLWGTDTIQEG